MTTIKGLYRLARPFNALTGAIAVFLGGYVAGTNEWGNVFLAAMTTILVTASSNAWNDYLDIEIDKINQPKRPLPAGEVSPPAAVIFSILCAVASLILIAFVNWPAFIVAAACNLLLYVYSWKLKSTVLMGNATVAVVSAASAVFGGVAAGNFLPTLWLALVIGVAIMMREVLKTMADYEGDLRESVRTVATVWGKHRARVLFVLLAISTTLVMFLPAYLKVYHPIYAIIVGVGVVPVIVYIMTRVRRDSTGPQLEQLSQIIKYDFLVWLLAVFLGTAA